MNEQTIQWLEPHESVRDPAPVDRLDELVWRGEKNWGGQSALEFHDQTWTYEELAEEVRSLATGLESIGVERGDRVIILGENSPYWLMLYFATVALGATAVPLEPDRGEEGLKRALRLTDPAAGFVMPSMINLPFWKQRLGDNLFELDREGKEIATISKAPEGTFPREAGDPGDVASILFTSGTTGQAKGVCLTHENLMADLDGLYQLGYFEQSDRFLSLLPMYHAYEFTGGQMLPMYTGATIVYAEELVSTVVMRHLKEDGITMMLGVPLLYQKLADKINKARSDMGWFTRTLFDTMRSFASGDGFLSNFARNRLRDRMREKGFADLRFMVSGGAPLNPDVARLFISLGIPMIQGYGMTELSPVVAVNLPGSPYPGSVGKALKNAKVGLRNPDEGGLGEVVVSGPMVLNRYLNSDEPPEDPFPTGDVGRIHDGHLFIEGRKKFTIVTAEGKNVFPEQVEEVYGESPYIEEILVVGQERTDASGVQLKAIVHPNDERLSERFDGEDPSEPEVTEVIRQEIRSIGEKLEPHQRVRDFELRWEPFPRTPTKKIKRHLFDSSVHAIDDDE